MSEESLEFVCNICSTRNICVVSALDRERKSCTGCNSSVRTRAIVHLLSVSLFGEGLEIRDFPESRHLVGIGMSDWLPYARRLEEKLGYRNTYYHQAPRLDITRVPDELHGTCDFIVSTDVYEHVLAPVSLAFDGAHQLLKDDGVLVFSVPFTNKGEETVEHFRGLHDFHIEQADGTYRLVNRNVDGTEDVYTGLKFHGGPGETLEMRLFCRASLLAEFERAGFDVVFFDQDVPEHGIIWHQSWSTPLVARKRGSSVRPA
jgi:hypothetical protein